MKYYIVKNVELEGYGMIFTSKNGLTFKDIALGGGFWSFNPSDVKEISEKDADKANSLYVAFCEGLIDGDEWEFKVEKIFS